MFQLAHMSCASMHLAHFPRWLGSTSASKWRTKLMRCGNRTGQRATGGTWKKDDMITWVNIGRAWGHGSNLRSYGRLGAMGLAERKEVKLDFSKEDDEKSHGTQIICGMVRCAKWDDPDPSIPFLQYFLLDVLNPDMKPLRGCSRG